jgi:hypothetical protein
MREAHSIHRKLIMISEVQQQIASQTRTKTASRQILINLRVNLNEKNSIIKTRDVYNRRQKIKHQVLSNLTVTQALLQELFVRKH